MLFSEEKRSSLLGHTEVVFQCKATDTEFTVVASRYGVQLLGHSPFMRTTKDLDGFAKVLTKAWQQHKKLLPKLEAVSGGFDAKG